MKPIWQTLEQNYAENKARSIASLFDKGDRLARFSATADELYLDVAKTNIDDDALDALLALAEAAGLAERRAAMFAGEKINTTEGRAVLHTALRSSEAAPLLVDGRDVRPAIAETLARMEIFAEGVRSGKIASQSGAPFTDVVNIGIGGSDLGPAMARLAFAPYQDGPRTHFISNVDGAHARDTLRGIDPATTLVIVASKTFTTIETMTNAETVFGWLRGALGEKIGTHLAAVSTAQELTSKMGIDRARVFGFADWVGGRYSLWGPVGLPIMLAIGAERFREFLDGAAALDAHFQNAPLAQNLPVLLALTGIWHRNICGYDTRAVLPYDQRLARLPAYLQQLDMESNGKRVQMDGTAVERDTGPVVWGEPGTNGQHAFYQFLHQGTDVIPVEFLIAAEAHEPELAHHHDLLKANCLAQSEALMLGRSFEEAKQIASRLGFEGTERERQAAHRTFPGNRPSVTLAYPKLTPFVLGQLIALYEHRVFVEGVVWKINSFDQWGVELGKELANALLPMVQGDEAKDKDPSTTALLERLRE
ncbi:glucose-6-phosphate isomerase [Lutimaribacter marinistellae]|uniref:Glucose-6-phosphate isomerase n=1 Tax=Lutimaribacter marinistellae TaxID=1820329 RepID=A0ABV7TEV0_9RHOB